MPSWASAAIVLTVLYVGARAFFVGESFPDGTGMQEVETDAWLYPLRLSASERSMRIPSTSRTIMRYSLFSGLSAPGRQAGEH
jgi:hypothetical protein